MTDPSKRILVLSDTLPGKTHDKTGANEAAIFDLIPPTVKVHVDLAFLGVPKEQPHLQIDIPEKKPKGKSLSSNAKARNREKARRRVLIEHAFGGVKRFRAVADIFRNNLVDNADRIMVVACGLWNLHVEMAG